MELAFDRGDDGPSIAKVTKRIRDAQGLPIGTSNDNPILDTQIYEVEYLDGFTTSMADNSIAENMFSQVDEEGNCHVRFDEIVEHRCDGNQFKMQEAFFTNTQGEAPSPHYKGLVNTGKMERREYNLDYTQRYERIISGSTGRICCPEPHFIGTSVRVVGPIRHM